MRTLRQRYGSSALSISCAVAMAVIAVASCGSSAPSSSKPTHPPLSTSTTGPEGATTNSSKSTSAAVVNAWESGELILYDYLAIPWQGDRAKLIAGETAATLWPTLSRYFINRALQSEQHYLRGVRMAELSGPVTFDLGNPMATSLTSTSATVTSCVYDTGTMTADGKPGPATLGGGASSSDGTWILQLVRGAWKIASFKLLSLAHCP